MPAMQKPPSSVPPNAAQPGPRARTHSPPQFSRGKQMPAQLVPPSQVAVGSSTHSPPSGQTLESSHATVPDA
ncbi:MAG TPA: hypothetical protein VGG39_11890 [Polyangiaceae bacterium]